MTVRVTNIQGCNLTCPWCCNPENISFEIENYIHNGQNESFGYDISLDALEKEILKDEVFYAENNGGVTFSGGEPLLQIRELEPLLKSLKSKNINICFETSLSAPSDLLEIAIEYIDEIFIDIKVLDKKEAKNVLNLDIDLYYENLELINSSNLDKKNITFRIPLNCIEKYSYFNVEIFKTHNLAESKCKSLNQEFISFSAVDDRELKEVLEKIQELNSNAKIISL